MSAAPSPEREVPTAQVDEAETDEVCTSDATNDQPISRHEKEGVKMMPEIPDGPFSENIYVYDLSKSGSIYDSPAFKHWSLQTISTRPNNQRRSRLGTGLCQKCHAIWYNDLTRLRMSELKTSQVVLIGINDWPLLRTEEACKACIFFGDLRWKSNPPDHLEFHYLIITTADILGLVQVTLPLGIISTAIALSHRQWGFENVQWGDTLALTGHESKRDAIEHSPYGCEVYDGISRSLQDCTMTHGERCAEMSLPRNINLRCIDCEGMKVVDLPSNSRYLALSYVWGACSNVEKEANLSDVPAVIKDAIFVTLQLSFRFLWIDRYCIDQNDDMEKHNQIANMGSIYAGATMTIIAAGGTDAHSGLPGASSCHCDLDEGFQLGTYSLIPVLGNPKEALNRSKWSTRGWTYQEATLSPRKLIFLPNGCYYQCDMTHTFTNIHRVGVQTIVTPIDSKYGRSYGGSASAILFPSRLIPTRTDIEAFYLHVNNYVQRSLTYDSDRFKAIQGVLNTFRDRFRPVFQVWGVGFTTSQYFTILHGISWYTYSLEGVRRQSLFPSWSWLGWKLLAQRPFDMININGGKFDNELLPDEYTATVEIELEGGETLRLTETAINGTSLGDKLTLEAKYSCLLNIQASVFAFALTLSNTNLWDLIPRGNDFGELDYRVIPDQPNLVRPGTHGNVIGMVLGQFLLGIRVLIVRQTERVWERVGIAEFGYIISWLSETDLKDRQRRNEKAYLEAMKKLERCTVSLG